MHPDHIPTLRVTDPDFTSPPGLRCEQRGRKMLRSRVPSTSRAASTVFKRGVQLASQHPPLKTEADWTQLQYDRAYVSQLSEWRLCMH